MYFFENTIKQLMEFNYVHPTFFSCTLIFIFIITQISSFHPIACPSPSTSPHFDITSGLIPSPSAFSRTLRNKLKTPRGWLFELLYNDCLEHRILRQDVKSRIRMLWQVKWYLREHIDDKDRDNANHERKHLTST